MNCRKVADLPLQWGRDHVIAEFCRVILLSFGLVSASMGPRSRDRGIFGVQHALSVDLLASMGPRSRDRGIAATAFLPHVLWWLQWGRDHVIAELYAWTAAPHAICDASMGPRSRDRGILTPESGAQIPTRASMGPRSRDRGIMAPAGRTRSQLKASMGPRSRDRGIHPAPQREGLQGEASMGPRSRDRGIQVPGAYALGPLRLQWGRDHVIAELQKSQGNLLHETRFNGAAIT